MIVERDGDPAAALAFASKSKAGATALLALSHILRRRIHAATSLDFNVFPNAFGLTINFLVDTPERAKLAIGTLDRVLGKPIEAQLDAKLIEELRMSQGQTSNVNSGERSLADCTGELLLDASRNELADLKRLRDSVDQARIDVRSRNNARFAVVGRKVIATEVEKALSDMPSWPSVEHSRLDEATRRPVSTQSYTTSTASLRRLSIAWQVRSGTMANSAATSIRQRGSPLMSQVTAFDDDWKVENVSSVARDVGGCLRIDLSIGNETGPISVNHLRNLVRIVVNESRRALDGTAPHDDAASIPLENDPQRAARRLAWSSLSIDDESPQKAPQVHLRLLPTDAPFATLEATLREAVVDNTVSPFDTAFRQELGQTELWVALASPCGTGFESSSDAGATAAWVQGIARRFGSHLGVQLEPLLTEDGLGLIAHTGPRFPAESASSIARRLGDALGSVVATGMVPGSELAAVREDTLLRLGPSPRRAWWQLVDALSSGHPATFEPLGTFESLRNMDLGTVRSRRTAWLRQPLRVAALLNRSREQASDIQASLHRWLDPHRQPIEQCQPVETRTRASQEIQISAKSNDARDANAYVALQLAPALEHAFVYEHWLQWLLVRPGGWLETALVGTGNLNAFTADIKGPRYNRTVIIGLNSDDESRISEAVYRIRDLFNRLAKQGPDPRELDLAQTWSEEQIRRAELDPRRRLLDLWRGDSAPPKTPKSAFTRYLNQALASAPVTVVRVRRQP